MWCLHIQVWLCSQHLTVLSSILNKKEKSYKIILYPFYECDHVLMSSFEVKNPLVLELWIEIKVSLSDHSVNWSKFSQPGVYVHFTVYINKALIVTHQTFPADVSSWCLGFHLYYWFTCSECFCDCHIHCFINML